MHISAIKFWSNFLANNISKAVCKIMAEEINNKIVILNIPKNVERKKMPGE